MCGCSVFKRLGCDVCLTLTLSGQLLYSLILGYCGWRNHRRAVNSATRRASNNPCTACHRCRVAICREFSLRERLDSNCGHQNPPPSPQLNFCGDIMSPGALRTCTVLFAIFRYLGDGQSISRSFGLLDLGSNFERCGPCETLELFLENEIND